MAIYLDSKLSGDVVRRLIISGKFIMDIFLKISCGVWLHQHIKLKAASAKMVYY